MKLLSIQDAFELATGTRPHPATVCRYALRGVGGVKLQTWMVGGKRMTTVFAVEKFIQERTAKVQEIQSGLLKQGLEITTATDLSIEQGVRSGN